MTGQRLAALYREYGPVIYWRCAKLLRDEAAAEDATQETFLRVCRHLDAAPDIDEALRWIWRIATNYCLSEVRNRQRRPEPREELPDLPADVRIEQVLSDRQAADGRSWTLRAWRGGASTSRCLRARCPN